MNVTLEDSDLKSSIPFLIVQFLYNIHSLSSAYNEPYCQQKKGRFELQTTINQSNILRLLTSGLITTNTAAFCILPKADSVAYGFLMVDTDESTLLASSLNIIFR